MFEKHPQDREWHYSITVDPYHIFYVVIIVNIVATAIVFYKLYKATFKLQSLFLLMCAWGFTLYLIRPDHTFPIVTGIGSVGLSALSVILITRNPRE
jgi:hypothetical protein